MKVPSAVVESASLESTPAWPEIRAALATEPIPVVADRFRISPSTVRAAMRRTGTTGKVRIVRPAESEVTPHGLDGPPRPAPLPSRPSPSNPPPRRAAPTEPEARAASARERPSSPASKVTPSAPKRPRAPRSTPRTDRAAAAETGRLWSVIGRDGVALGYVGGTNLADAAAALVRSGVTDVVAMVRVEPLW